MERRFQQVEAARPGDTLRDILQQANDIATQVNQIAIAVEYLHSLDPCRLPL